MLPTPQQPDYTRQFDQIVEILNRKTMPQWVWLLVGWFLGIASTLLLRLLDYFWNRRNLRRMLYREMAQNYWQLSLLRSRMMLPKEEQLINKAPKDVIEFGAFEYARQKRDNFERLKDVVDFEVVYEKFRQCEELSVESATAVFTLNSRLDTFEKRVGKVFDKKLLLAVSSPVVREAIELIS